MSLLKVRDALLTVTEEVYHLEPTDEAQIPYIVWAEDTQSGGIYSDCQTKKVTLQGTIDYYTTTEYDENVGLINDALNAAYIPHWIGSIQHDKNTGITHYEWIFEV